MSAVQWSVSPFNSVEVQSLTRLPADLGNIVAAAILAHLNTVDQRRGFLPVRLCPRMVPMERPLPPAPTGGRGALGCRIVPAKPPL